MGRNSSVEPTYRTIHVAPRDQEGNPLILLDTLRGRKTLKDTILEGDPETKWTVWRGEDMTYPDWERLEAHAGW